MENLINKKSENSIMDFDLNELISTCKIFLSKFDDYQQMSTDNETANYFAHSYNELEIIIFDLKEQNLTTQIRNQIRMILKETEKMAACQFCK